jgi:pimeloyl-ACP methyl ester carboxylesterase
VGYDYWPVQPISSLQTPVIRQMLMAALDIGAFRTIIARGLYYRNRVTPELMDYFWKPMRSDGGRKAFLHFAECLDNRDLTSISDDIGRLAIPVLIIRGMNDLYLSRLIGETLHKNIPGSRYEQVNEAGHFIMEDQPEQIVDILKRFYA